jgi:hypothetical protein
VQPIKTSRSLSNGLDVPTQNGLKLLLPQIAHAMEQSLDRLNSTGLNCPSDDGNCDGSGNTKSGGKGGNHHSAKMKGRPEVSWRPFELEEKRRFY